MWAAGNYFFVVGSSTGKQMAVTSDDRLLVSQSLHSQGESNITTEAVPGDLPVPGLTMATGGATEGSSGDDLCSLKVYENGRFSHRAEEK
jgi:hypothetical protein